MSTNGDRSATGHSTRQTLGQRHSIPEAAKALGLTEEAVRQRVKRGTLDSIKVGGSLFVLMDADRSSDGPRDQDRPVEEASVDRTNRTSDDGSRLVENLEDQVEFLRAQLDQERGANRENRRIIAGLVQRVPELESPSEMRDAPETASPRSDGGTAAEGTQEPAERRSWWRRFFGFE